MTLLILISIILIAGIILSAYVFDESISDILFDYIPPCLVVAGAWVYLLLART
jgi:hypothetical protein